MATAITVFKYFIFSKVLLQKQKSCQCFMHRQLLGV
jgi:hypothetical protein